MSNVLEQPVAREDVLQAMRELAARGTTVRELTQVVLTRLGYTDNAVLPVIWYFTQAFSLPLNEVLPIREWLGTDRDGEINALILPAIERTRSKWTLPGTRQPNGTAEGRQGSGVLPTDHRS